MPPSKALLVSFHPAFRYELPQSEFPIIQVSSKYLINDYFPLYYQSLLIISHALVKINLQEKYLSNKSEFEAVLSQVISYLHFSLYCFYVASLIGVKCPLIFLAKA